MRGSSWVKDPSRSINIPVQKENLKDARPALARIVAWDSVASLWPNLRFVVLERLANRSMQRELSPLDPWRRQRHFSPKSDERRRFVPLSTSRGTSISIKRGRWLRYRSTSGELLQQSPSTTTPRRARQRGPVANLLRPQEMPMLSQSTLQEPSTHTIRWAARLRRRESRQPSKQPRKGRGPSRSLVTVPATSTGRASPRPTGHESNTPCSLC